MECMEVQVHEKRIHVISACDESSVIIIQWQKQISSHENQLCAHYRYCSVIIIIIDFFGM